MTLSELKVKYNLSESAKYEPNPICRHCNGIGERPIKSRPSDFTFCICLYIDHSVSDEMGSQLGKIAREQLKKLRGQI